MNPLSLADADYTIMALIRPAEIRFTGTQYIVGPHMWNRICLKIEDAKLKLFHRSPRNHHLSAPPREYTDGIWRHVAGTFSRRNGMAVYIGGELMGLDTTTTSPSKYLVALIGASGDGATKDARDVTGCFKGAIDEVRIYRRELSYREIRYHAQAAR